MITAEHIDSNRVTRYSAAFAEVVCKVLFSGLARLLTQEPFLAGTR